MEENSIRFEDIPNAITGVLKKLVLMYQPRKSVLQRQKRLIRKRRNMVYGC